MGTAALRPASLGAELELRRLQHRERRLIRVVAALEERARRYEDGPPPGLRESLAGFREELAQVRAALTAA